MSDSNKNIYITIVTMLYKYGMGIYQTIKRLFIGAHSQSIVSPILDEIASRGPASFQEHPSAIRLGRALFGPLILISHIYDKK